jgi:hypothetical protein
VRRTFWRSDEIKGKRKVLSGMRLYRWVQWCDHFRTIILRLKDSVIQFARFLAVLTVSFIGGAAIAATISSTGDFP